MTAFPLRRLPDPVPPAGAARVMTYGLALDPTGTWLVHSFIDLDTFAGGTALYTRTGAGFVRGTVDHTAGQTAGVFTHVAISPGGRWVAAVNAAGDPRLLLYRRQGNALTCVGQIYDITTYALGLASGNTSLAFDATGRHLAVGDQYGVWSGLVTLDDAGPVAAAKFDVPAFSVAWNPADPGQLLTCDPYGMSLHRLTGDTLDRVGTFTDGASRQSAIWHPSGRVVLATEVNGCGSIVPVAYDYPSAVPLGTLPEYTYNIAGYAFSPDGSLLAGTGIDMDVYQPRGLILAAVDLAGGRGYDDVWGGYRVYDPPAEADNISAMLCAFGADAGGLYLAASSYPGFWSAPDPGYRYQSPAGLHLYGTTAGPSSVLSMRQPSGAFDTVGTTSRPLGLDLGDGTLRVWPDTSAPLLQRTDDGTWRQVIG